LIARYNCYLHYTEVLCLWVLCFVYSKCSKCTNLIISLFQMCHHVMHLFGNKRYMCIFIFVGWSLEVINLVRIGSFLCWSGLVSFRLIWLVWLVSSIWLFSLVVIVFDCTSPYWFFWLHCTSPYCTSSNWLHFSRLILLIALHFFWLIALLPIDSSDCIALLPMDFFWLVALLPIGFFYLIASIYWLILMFCLVWICSIGFVLVSLDWIVCWINLIWFSSLRWFLCRLQIALRWF
jgi:hypothetical protein